MSDVNALVEDLVSGDETAVLKALTGADPSIVSTIKTAAAKVDKLNADNQKQDVFNSLESVFNTLRQEVEEAVTDSFTNEKDLKVEMVVSMKDGKISSMIKARKKGVKHPLVIGPNGLATLADFADFGRNKREVIAE